MVSKDGFVKILDFGLAKLGAGPVDGVSSMETAARPGTSPGAVVGTVGYMSPEQASGRPVDFRSDQFSLGAVLYEMVTGSKPFARKHQRRDARRDHPRRAGRPGQAQPALARAAALADRALPGEGPRGSLLLDARSGARSRQPARAPLRVLGLGRRASRGARSPPLGPALGLGGARPRGRASALAAAAFRPAATPAPARSHVHAAHVPARHGALRALRARRPDGRLQRRLGGTAPRDLHRPSRRTRVAIPGPALRRRAVDLANGRAGDLRRSPRSVGFRGLRNAGAGAAGRGLAARRGRERERRGLGARWQPRRSPQHGSAAPPRVPDRQGALRDRGLDQPRPRGRGWSPRAVHRPSVAGRQHRGGDGDRRQRRAQDPGALRDQRRLGDERGGRLAGGAASS